MRLAQSAAAPHSLPVAQPGHPPPQSRSVSAPLRTPSAHDGAAMVKVAGTLAPPAGSPLVTVTRTSPAAPSNVAGMTAVTRRAETREVATSTPPNLAWTPAWKPVPSIVSVKPPLPRGTLAGESALIAGTGFSTVKVRLTLAL